jgi:uncharacterized protein (DUF1697 family)
MPRCIALLRAVNVGGTGALPMARAVDANGETMALGKREIFIHYPSGMGRSRLRIAAAKNDTARNMNTVARLAELAAKR